MPRTGLITGAPANIKAVAVRFSIIDNTVSEYAYLGPGSGAGSNSALGQGVQVANVWTSGGSGIVPCDANGDIYFYQSGNLNGVYLEIWGYFI